MESKSTKNIEQKKKNDKIFKITMIITISSILIVTVICSILIFESNKNFKNNNTLIENNDTHKKDSIYTYPSEEIVNNASTLKKAPIRVFCSLNDSYRNIENYLVREDTVYCNFSLQTDFDDSVDEIWTEYELNDKIEYLKVLEKNDSIEITSENNKLHFNNHESQNMHYGHFYTVKLKLKDNQNKNNIVLPKVLLKNIDGKYYKYEEPIISEFNIFDDELTKYTYHKDKGIINFYKYNKSKYAYEKINTYKCKSQDCSMDSGSYNSFSYNDFNNGIHTINDSEKYYLFDFEKGIIKGSINEFDDVVGELLEDNTEKVKYLLVTNDSIKYIIDFKGNVIKKLDKYDFNTSYKMCYIQNIYSISNNIMVVNKNNKKGIVKITEDKVVVDFLYDDIKLFDNKYFKAKIGNKWYLYDLNTNTKVNENGYKEIFPVKDNLMVAQIDDYLYIKDFKGNNIIKDKIKVLYDYQEFAYEASQGYYIFLDDKDKNILHIWIDDDYASGGRFEYKYDIAKKKLYNLGKINDDEE